MSADKGDEGRPALAPATGISWLRSAAGLHLLSGQVALDPNGALVGEGDPAIQSDQIFANIDALLEEVGGSIHDVVHLRVFLSSAEAYPAYAAAKARWFPGDTMPAGTAVIVTSLLDPRFLLEVEATAVDRGARG